MKVSKFKRLCTALVAVVAAPAAFAVPTTIFNTDITAGASAFDATVTGVGATVVTDNLSGLFGASSWDRGDYTISNTDGSSSSVFPAATDSSSGQMIGINPQLNSGATGATPNDYDQSGLTFTFDTAINALGFEVGDWATCCYPSALYIQFDGGAVQQVGLAATFAAFLGSNQSVFVSAIDDTDTFTSVSFWGDGVGEFLTAGGTIRYAAVPQGSIGVPAPATLALLGMGLLMAGIRRKTL